MDLIFPSFVPPSSFLNEFISQYSKIWFLVQLFLINITLLRKTHRLLLIFTVSREGSNEKNDITSKISELLVRKVCSLTSLFYFFLFKVRFIDEYFTYIKFTLFIPFYSSRSFDFCANYLMTIKSSPNAFDSHSNPKCG